MSVALSDGVSMPNQRLQGADGRVIIVEWQLKVYTPKTLTLILNETIVVSITVFSPFNAIFL